MDDTRHSRIQKLATEFRLAIEQSKGLHLIIATFRDFPRGACGEASLLLAKYLEESGFGKFDYILGSRRGQSHAWLRQDDLVVDITADQFDDVSNVVIVTTDHTWHLMFHGNKQHVADIDGYDSAFKSNARAAYSKILETMRDFKGK